jgi:beta-xylosidase
VTVTVEQGCGVLESEPQNIQAAVEAARDADVVIVAIGGTSGWFSDGLTEGEGSDTANIDLPAQQVELVRAVAATGKPVIGVLSTGRPFALTNVEPHLSALLHAYYGGERGNQAAAEVIAGVINPSGKLPYSMPRHTGQVPIYAGQRNGTGYARTAADIHKGYVDMPSTPLYPFGHGLSYTSFEYGDLSVSDASVRADQSITVTVPVRNTGHTAGAEIVQIYASLRARGQTRPAQELIGFHRAHLAPGETAQIRFDIALEQLAYLALDGQAFTVEAGEVQVLVGASSDDIRGSSSFTVTESARFEHKNAFLASSTVTIG